MSFLNRALNVAKSALRSPQARRLARQVTDELTKDSKQKSAPRSGSSSRPTNKGRHAAPHPSRSGGGMPGPDDQAIVYSFAEFGAPNFTFEPADDGDADPGEVVWTWVPYEDDPTQGKDRPVLVVARVGECVVFAQMTSKDHVDGPGSFRYEDHLGRHWMDMGSGNWDREGRPSEVRIDRLLLAHKNSIRREGGKLDKTRFTQITSAISSIHGK